MIALPDTAPAVPALTTAAEALERVEIAQAAISDIEEQLKDFRIHGENEFRDRSWAARARKKLTFMRVEIAQLRRTQAELSASEKAARHQAYLERQRAENENRAGRREDLKERQGNLASLIVDVVKDEFDADEWERIVEDAVKLAIARGVRIEDRILAKHAPWAFGAFAMGEKA